MSLSNTCFKQGFALVDEAVLNVVNWSGWNFAICALIQCYHHSLSDKEDNATRVLALLHILLDNPFTFASSRLFM